MQTTETATQNVKPGSSWRSKAPVFIIGCGRSGTTLLYHMVLSSGNFAIYRTESNAINLLEPRFGDLSKAQNKRRLLEAWYESRLYTLSGLDREQIGKKVMSEVRNGGDFLRVIMEEMCRQQGVERWADCTPEHILRLDRIKETIPDALIVHIIRDGRDSSVSMEVGNWIRPFPWQKNSNLMICGLYWEWMVNKGRHDGRRLGNQYTEVRFEELVSNPRETLAKLGEFIEHDLDYDRIREVGIGSVSAPNTSFKGMSSKEEFNPVGRWKERLSAAQLREFEGLVGATLQELGYSLATCDWSFPEKFKFNSARAGYRAVFDSKLWMKTQTPLGRLLTTRKLDWI